MSEIVLTFFKQHQVEIVILSLVSMIILNCIFLVIILKSPHESDKTSKKDSGVQHGEPIKDESIVKTDNSSSGTIIVDISGAVVHPGAYTVSANDRLSHVLTEAGGLSSVADKDFFARNYNSAARLIDQQKIYVPRIDEIENGIFIENAYSVDHTLCINSNEPASSNKEVEVTDTDGAVSINSASVKELDTLPSIGPVTAQKIIDSRPYTSLEKLVELKILSQKAFDELKDTLKL